MLELRRLQLGERGIVRPKRLVWGGAEKAPDKPLEYKESEKNSKEKMQPIVDKIKVLTLADAKPIAIDSNNDKKVDAVEFKNVLKKQIEGIGIKNLDTYLMTGLMDNLGIPSKNLQLLTNWLQDPTGVLKQKGTLTPVQSFKIVNGEWQFFSDADGKNPIQKDFALDDEYETKEGKKTKKAETAKATDSTALTREVYNQKKEDQKKTDDEKAAKDTKDKADKERLDGGELMKLESKVLSFGRGVKTEDLCKDLAVSLKDQRLSMEELSSALKSYMTACGQADEAKFWQAVSEKGYLMIQIKEGKFIFSGGANNPDTSNPLNLFVKGEPMVAYIHENAKEAAGKQEKQQQQEKQAEDDAKKDRKSTRFDPVEEKLRALSAPKAPALKPGETAPAAQEAEKKGPDIHVDARYLPAFEAILNYQNGAPVKCDIPFGDGALNCRFFQEANGRYCFNYDVNNPKAVITYMPFDNSQDKVGDMQRYFAEQLNKGTLLRDIQICNVKDKAYLEAQGFKVDEGPEVAGDGSINYELDWKSGINGDPDFNIKVLPHGEMEVVVKKDGIDVGGGDEYRFRAGGMPDLIRKLKSLEKWNDASDEEKEEMKKGEQERRKYEQVVNGKYPAFEAAERLGAGKILKVDSVPNLSEGEGAVWGQILHLDWMDRLYPGGAVKLIGLSDGRVQVSYVGDRYNLGVVKDIDEAMRLLAEQRLHVATNGGAERMKSNFGEMLKSIKPAVELAAGVVVRDVVTVGPTQRVFLSIDGYAAAEPFPMNAEGMQLARAKGYLRGALGEAPPKPDEKDKPKGVESAKVASDQNEHFVEAPTLNKSITRLLNQDISYKQLDAGRQAELTTYLEARMVGSGVNSMTTDSDFKPKMAELLLDLRKQVYGEESAPKVGSELSVVLNDLSGKIRYSTTSFDQAKAKQYFEKGEMPQSLKDAPQTTSFVTGLIDGLPGAGEDLKVMRADYAKLLVSLVGGIRGGLSDKEKKKPLALQDRLILEALKKQVMNPAKFAEKWTAAKTAKDQYDRKVKDYQNYTSSVETNGKQHAMTFEDLNKAEPKSGLCMSSMKLMQSLIDSNYVTKEQINLSSVPENKPGNDGVIFFNLKTTAPNAFPYTVRVERGTVPNGVKISVVSGWNNDNRINAQAFEFSKVWDSSKNPPEDCVKGLVDDVLLWNRGYANRESNVTPPSAPKPAEPPKVTPSTMPIGSASGGMPEDGGGEFPPIGG